MFGALVCGVDGVLNASTQLLHPIVTTSVLLLLSCRWTLGEVRPVLRDNLVTECYTDAW